MLRQLDSAAFYPGCTVPSYRRRRRRAQPPVA